MLGGNQIRYQVRQGIHAIIAAVCKVNKLAVVGMVGITHRSSDYDSSRIHTINYNRAISTACKEVYNEGSAMQFVPLHLHFLDSKYILIQPSYKYFTDEDEFTVLGAFILRQMLLKEIGILPISNQY